MERIVLIPTPNGDKTRHPRSACEVFAALFSPFSPLGEMRSIKKKAIVAILGCYCESFSLR
jgi:hypothetical protein